MNRTILKPTEYNQYYATYLSMVADDIALIEGHIQNKNNLLHFFKSIPKEKHNYAYAEGKWTIKEVLQHIIDTERVFMYRCLCIARQDKTAFPGFDQDAYISPSEANLKTMDALLEELESTKNNSIALIKSISESNFANIGTASGGNLSARAAAFIILGHDLWHTKVLKERYL